MNQNKRTSRPKQVVNTNQRIQKKKNNLKYKKSKTSNNKKALQCSRMRAEEKNYQISILSIPEAKQTN